MLGCVVNSDPAPDLASDFLAECIGQGFAAVGVEVIHYQVDGLGVGVLHRQVAGEQRELKGGSIPGGRGEVAARFGFHRAENIGSAATSYSLSLRASRPGTAGDGGRTSACKVTGFSSRHTTGSCGS